MSYPSALYFHELDEVDKTMIDNLLAININATTQVARCSLSLARRTHSLLRAVCLLLGLALGGGAASTSLTASCAGPQRCMGCVSLSMRR
jgi:hypothetical protein